MKKLAIIILTISIISCKSTEVENTQLSNSLLGVVYDNKSNPIQGARLLFTSSNDKRFKLSVTTDIDGKFLVPEIEFGDYNIEVTSNNCSPTRTKIEHRDIENVLIIKVFTKVDQIDLFQKHIFNNNLELAKEKMKLIEDIDGDDQYYNYLKSIYYIESNMLSEAEDLLLKLVKSTEDDPHVNLLLADLYEYHILDNSKALLYLKKYIREIYTEKEAKRIKEIESVL